MVTIVIVKNPFEPWNGREVQKIEYKGSVGMLLALYSKGGSELQATINGYCTANITQVNDGDFIVIFPVVEKGGGKSILGVIAAVALSGGRWVSHCGSNNVHREQPCWALYGHQG